MKLTMRWILLKTDLGKIDSLGYFFVLGCSKGIKVDDRQSFCADRLLTDNLIFSKVSIFQITNIWQPVDALVIVLLIF